MDDRERRLAFTRDEVAGRPTTKRIELDGADVESVLRTLQGRLADEERFASFEEGVRARLDSERDDGSSRLEGRLSAAVGREAADATVEFRPYGPHGAMAMVVGAIFALPTLFVTLLLAAAGYALYRIERTAAVPLERVTTVDVFVSESRSEPAGDSTRADADGAVRVVAAAETGYAVDSDRAAQLEWPRRKAVLAQVRDWTELALESGRHRKTADDAFFSHLNMCWNRNPEADAAAIDDAQRRAFAASEGRAAYSELLREPTGRDEDDRANPDRLLEDLFDGLARETEN